MLAVSERSLRVDRTDAASMLLALSGSEPVASGRAQIIGLDVFRERLGEAWTLRQSRVWDHLEQHAARHLSPADLLLRLSEVDYLLVTPTTSIVASQGMAMNILREVLVFFFGRAEAGDIVVRTVQSLSGDRVEARVLTPDETARAFGAMSGGEGGHPRAEPTPLARFVPRRTPLLGVIGRELVIKSEVRPLVDLRNGGTVGFAIQSRACAADSEATLSDAEVHALSPAALEATDLASLEAAEALFGGAEKIGQRLMVLPLQLSTLAASRGRLAFLNWAHAAPAPVRANLILEIVGLQSGFIASRVREAVAMARPVCRAVFARLPPVRGVAEPLQGAGLRGISVLANDLAQAARIDPDPRKLTEAAALVGPGLMIIGLRTAKAVEVARAVGASLAVLDAAYCD